MRSTKQTLKPSLNHTTQLLFYRKFLPVLFLFLLFASPRAFAIWNNFGDGHETTGNHATVGSPIYTDDVRAQTTSVTGNNLSVAVNVSSTTIVGSFTVGDVVIVVNMGTNASTRNYNFGTVSGTSSSVITVTPANLAWDIFNGSLTAAQIVKVHQFASVLIDAGAMVTCHPYSLTAGPGYGSGGILCFMCKGTLTMNASGSTTGMVNADATGGLTLVGTNAGLHGDNSGASSSAPGGAAATGGTPGANGTDGNTTGGVVNNRPVMDLDYFTGQSITSTCNYPTGGNGGAGSYFRALPV